MAAIRRILGILLLSAGCVTPAPQVERGNAKVVQTKHGTCTILAPENHLHPSLVACDEAQHYTFTSGARHFNYDKTFFQTRFRERLEALLAFSAYPRQALAECRVEIWMLAPVFYPEQARLLAVVLGPGGNFALPFPVDLGTWGYGTDQLLLLGSERWPTLVAHRAARLEARPQLTISLERARDAVSTALQELAPLPNGRPLVKSISAQGGGLVIATELFAEERVLQRLKQMPALISAAQWPEATFPSAYMAQIFAFDLRQAAK